MDIPTFQSAGSIDNDEPFEQPQVLDMDMVEKLCNQALLDSGYVVEEDGQLHADEKQLKMAVVQAMLDGHVVKGKTDMAAQAVTKFELYTEILPHGPGIDSLPDSPEGILARNKLCAMVWTLTNTGRSGHVQARIPTSGLILVEAEVNRTKVNQETGKKEPTTERGRFLTSDKDLILTHFTNPAGAKFLAHAQKLENLLGMVAERRPELALPVAQQLGVVMKQVVAAIPHANPRQVSALTTGSPTIESDDA